MLPLAQYRRCDKAWHFYGYEKVEVIPPVLVLPVLVPQVNQLQVNQVQVNQLLQLLHLHHRNSHWFRSSTICSEQSDLIKAFGNNINKAKSHYTITEEQKEEVDSFSPTNYLNNNSDLSAAFGPMQKMR